MITFDDAIYLDRKEAAKVLHVSVHTLAVWRSIEKYDDLHIGYFLFRGKTVYYKLSSIEKHFRKWDPVSYEYYTKHDKQILGYVDKATQ